MMENRKKPNVGEKMPAGTPWSKKEEPKPEPEIVHPPVTDPPVPNRAHTELRTSFPPEMPYSDRQDLL